MKLTIFKHVAVLSGTGVGGGSSVLYIIKIYIFKTGSWSKLHDLENELIYEALRMPGGAKNPKLFDGAGLKKVTQNWEWMMTPLQLPSIFEKRMLPKKDPYFVGMGPERTGCHQQHIF
jgi:cholesterol oxidase